MAPEAFLIHDALVSAAWQPIPAFGPLLDVVGPSVIERLDEEIAQAERKAEDLRGIRSILAARLPKQAAPAPQPAPQPGAKPGCEPPAPAAEAPAKPRNVQDWIKLKGATPKDLIGRYLFQTNDPLRRYFPDILAAVGCSRSAAQRALKDRRFFLRDGQHYSLTARGKEHFGARKGAAK